MCNVCCAGHAVDKTEAGGWADFTWDEDANSGILANNVNAPPLEVPVAAEGPRVHHLLVQAKLTQPPKPYGVEGPGSLRVRYTEAQEWSPWFEYDDLSNALGMLGVDMGWGWLFPEDGAEADDQRVGPIHAAQDLAALIAFIELDLEYNRQWSAGHVAGRAAAPHGVTSAESRRALLIAMRGEPIVWMAGALHGIMMALSGPEVPEDVSGLGLGIDVVVVLPPQGDES